MTLNNLLLSLKRNLLWTLYLVFLIVALSTHDKQITLLGEGVYPYGQTVLWLIWLAFLAYSLSISWRENFFKSLARMHPILWSRQIGLDLYIGLLVPLFLIYLNEGSLLITVIWLLPIFVFANLATLIYLALNYDSLIAYFVTL